MAAGGGKKSTQRIPNTFTNLAAPNPEGGDVPTAVEFNAHEKYLETLLIAMLTSCDQRECKGKHCVVDKANTHHFVNIMNQKFWVKQLVRGLSSLLIGVPALLTTVNLHRQRNRTVLALERLREE